MRKTRVIGIAPVGGVSISRRGSARTVRLKLAAVIVLMASMYTISSFAAGNGDRYVGAPFATRAPVIAQHGMAATMQPLASQIAIDVLKKGGTAVNAAVAAKAGPGLMGSVSCCVGGEPLGTG